jgi:hypothetical protein
MLLPHSIVPGEQLTRALTHEEVRINGTSLAGPSLAGVLYGLDHVAPFAFTAGAFFVTLVATALVPVLPVRQMRVRAHSCRPKRAPGPLGVGGRRLSPVEVRAGGRGNFRRPSEGAPAADLLWPTRPDAPGRL